MVPISLKQTYKEIPASVKQFAQKALALMLVWLVLYHLFLQPRRIPDGWLTNVTTNVTAVFLNTWYSPGFNVQQGYYKNGEGKTSPQALIMLNGRRALGVADGCNALELYVLYIGFLICMPAGLKRLAVFALAGTAMIFMLNIFRLYALTSLGLNYPAFFNFAHHYAFTLIVYCCIFFMWIWYSKKYIPQK